MSVPASLTLADHFAALDDPRIERTKLHPLLSIVVIAICAVIAGAESWDDIADFGEIRAEWLASFLILPHGIPSHDTFNRVFAALDLVQFQSCFLSWMQAVAGVVSAQVIAVDGKTVRGSRGGDGGKAAIHLVSAWASASRFVLAQTAVDEKSNEITAIPELLRSLAITGCIVTIDAMGCQRAIAQQILDQGGTYVLALKDNQETLAADVQQSAALAQADQFAGVHHDQTQTIEKGHGRIETRRAVVIDDAAAISWLQERHTWPGLAAHEDQSRIRVGHAAKNFAVLRHIALNVLRQATVKRRSIEGRRLKAAWDPNYLLQVLAGAQIRCVGPAHSRARINAGVKTRRAGLAKPRPQRSGPHGRPQRECRPADQGF